jgi:hypothetical protein
MGDIAEHLEQLRGQIAECELIRDRATEREKRALFAELAEQFKMLRSEIERRQAAARGEMG